LLATIDNYNKRTYLYLTPLGVVFVLSLYFWLDDLMVFLIVTAALVFLVGLVYLLHRNRYDDIKRLRELVG
jgi:predicted membrane channel-forming protein YqfA (hemolysin III family)